MSTGLIVYPGSYKFHRLFPLSQYDLPTHNPNILSFPSIQPRSSETHTAAAGVSPGSQDPANYGKPLPTKLAQYTEKTMSVEQIARNPGVDYTRYFGSLSGFLVSEVPSLSPDQTSYLSYSRTSESSLPKQSVSTWLPCLLADRLVPVHPIILLQILVMRLSLR